MSWAAIVVGVVGAGVSAASAAKARSDQKKAAAKASSTASGNQLAPVEFDKMPAYVPADYKSLDKQVAFQDNLAYNRSDLDFKRRHPEWRSGEKAFEHQATLDQIGDSRFMPQMQAEAINSGLEGTLGSFGDQGLISKRGSAGEARIAQNLGTSIAGWQDRNRQNANQSLSLAEQIFPRRNIGLSGADVGQIQLGNLSAQNAWNQANYASQVEQQQFNQKIAAGNQANAITTNNANAQAQANLGAAQAQMYGDLAKTALNAGGQAYGSYQAAHPRTATVTPTTTGVTQTWRDSAMGRA